jgi:hypothetical protein
MLAASAFGGLQGQLYVEAEAKQALVAWGSGILAGVIFWNGA